MHCDNIAVLQAEILAGIIAGLCKASARPLPGLCQASNASIRGYRGRPRRVRSGAVTS